MQGLACRRENQVKWFNVTMTCSKAIRIAIIVAGVKAQLVAFPVTVFVTLVVICSKTCAGGLNAQFIYCSSATAAGKPVQIDLNFSNCGTHWIKFLWYISLVARLPHHDLPTIAGDYQGNS